MHPCRTQLCSFGFCERGQHSPAFCNQVHQLIGFSYSNVSEMTADLLGVQTHFSSRYNSPRLTRAVSYSRVAASEVTEGGLEMISLNCASAFLASVFASFCASCILTESAGAILISSEKGLESVL